MTTETLPGHRSGAADAAPDPVTLALLWRSLINVSEEMGLTLRHTAFSPALREAHDYSASLHDPDGRLVAHGSFTPGHTGGSIFGVPQALARLDRPLAEGEAVLYNDLPITAGHLPDITSIAPIYVDRELIGYSVCSAHHSDVGGLAPGSLAIEGAHDVYAEGLRIEPVRYYVDDEPNPEVFSLLKANVRMPEWFEGDLRAQMSANRRGIRRIRELVEQYGVHTMRAAVVEIMDRSERRMREAIAALPDGRYRFADQMDDYGAGTEPIPMVATVEVRGEEIEVDFEGTGPQVAAGINSYLSFTSAYTVFALKAVLDPRSPQNAGSLRPITIKAPAGSFVNPRHPAPAAGRAIVLTRVVDVVIGALAELVPDRVVAAPSQFCNSSFGGIDPRTGGRFIYFELLFGGTGARRGSDGTEAVCSGLIINNIPVEVYEASSPMRVERLSIDRDSGGPGEFRGGCGVRKDIRVLAPDVSLTNMGDRCRFPSYGLFGGRPGTLGATTLLRDGAETVLSSKGSYEVGEGDVVSIRISGAGGCGEPRDRDPEAVRRDVLEGYVSVEAAARDYGVVLAGDGFEVDREATAARRARLAAAAGQGREA